MRRRVACCLVVFAAALGLLSAPALAEHDGDADASNMTQLFASPNATGAVNSDLAFWGDLAYTGNYDGFRIFDISDPGAPDLVTDFACFGPQNDPVVWKNKLLFVAIDRTLSGPECGATAVDHGDPTGWEGVRIFDVSDPADPQFVKGVYTDCGAHTITLYPKNRAQVMLYVSSYPLRAGPTCGPDNGPPAGNSPLHEKISVIRVPVKKPKAAKVVAQPAISYPGDPDNRFLPVTDHGLAAPDLIDGMTACHDIGVFVELRLAAGACAEQAQLWRIKRNGIPDTENPLWVFDDNVDEDGPGGGDAVVDFWHSATFSQDGTVVNFIDESFGSGCPPVTANVYGAPGDTGRMFFLDTATGGELSQFMIPRGGGAEAPSYCSAHVGNTVRTADADLLVNAWYTGGVDVIDFTDPTNPTEVAYWDDTSDNWSAYWYEGPGLGAGQFPVYTSDGVEDPPTGEGFQVFSVLSDVTTEPLAHLNPQTQETTLGDALSGVSAAGTTQSFRSVSSNPSGKSSGPRAGKEARHLAP